MITSFSNNLEFVISFLLGIISIILTIYFSLIGRKYKQISYTYQTTSVLSKENSIDKLSFKYKGKSLKSIFVTDFVIWCNGKELINHSDIASVSPLTIHSPVKILNYQVILSNEPCNNFRISQIGNDLLINFDYMKKNNGIAIKIIHTGSNKKFSVTCTVKDGKKTTYVNRRKGYFYTFFNRKIVKYILSRKLTSFIFIMFTIFFFPIAFIQSANYANNNFFGLPDTNIFMNLDSVIIFVLCVCSFLLSIPHISNLFKNEPPDDLISHTTCER